MPLFHPALQLPLQSCTNSIFQPAGGTRFSTKLFICLLYSCTRPLHGLNALAVYVEIPPYVTYATMYIISIFRDTFSNYTQFEASVIAFNDRHKNGRIFRERNKYKRERNKSCTVSFSIRPSTIRLHVVFSQYFNYRARDFPSNNTQYFFLRRLHAGTRSLIK